MATTVENRSMWPQFTVKSYDLTASQTAERESHLWMDEFLYNAMCAMGPDPLVLDLGCGVGKLVPVLEQGGIKRSVGIDLSWESLKIARETYPARDFRHGDMLSLSDVVNDERFDGFFAIACLMNILPENMQRFADGLRAVLKKGAVGVVATPEGTGEVLSDSEEFFSKTGFRVPPGNYYYHAFWQRDVLLEHFLRAGFTGRTFIPSGFPAMERKSSMLRLLFEAT